MPKLRVEDLDRIAAKYKRIMTLREGAGRVKIGVHMGACGISAGARRIVSELMGCVERSDASDILINVSGCAGFCSREPMMSIEVIGQAPVMYADLDENKVRLIFNEHVMKGRVVEEYVLAHKSEQFS